MYSDHQLAFVIGGFLRWSAELTFYSFSILFYFIATNDSVLALIVRFATLLSSSGVQLGVLSSFTEQPARTLDG